MRGTGRNVIALVMVLLLVFIAACAPTPKEITPAPTPSPEEVTPPPSPEPASTVEWGIIEIRVTDPPPPGVASANVTVENIEIHKVVDGVGEWITIIEGPITFDIVALAEGEEAEFLGSANITAGSFTQIRMDVIEVEGLLSDNTTSYTATVPSDKLKIVRPFSVEGGVTTVLTLDFDGDKSLIMTGRDEALFKPVVKLLIEKEKGEE